MMLPDIFLPCSHEGSLGHFPGIFPTGRNVLENVWGNVSDIWALTCREIGQIVRSQWPTQQEIVQVRRVHTNRNVSRTLQFLQKF